MSTRNGLRGARRLILTVVIAALALTVGGLTYAGLPVGAGSATAPRDVVPSTSKMFDHQPALLVVGDSYAAAYPDLVADKLGWSLSADVQDGTGFVSHTDTPSPAHAPFIDRLERDASTYHADYVLIDGGRNDLSAPPEQVLPAAEEYLNDVHSRWPEAKIIVVLPTFAASDESANYPAMADGLRRTADALGAYVIDPAGAALVHRRRSEVPSRAGRSPPQLQRRHLLRGQDHHQLDPDVRSQTDAAFDRRLVRRRHRRPQLPDLSEFGCRQGGLEPRPRRPRWYRVPPSRRERHTTWCAVHGAPRS